MNASNEPTGLNTADVWALLNDRLLQFFRRRVKDEGTAEDLLQETFVRIHKGIGVLDDAERLNAWVFRIARNLLTDHYRQRSRRDVPFSEGAKVIAELPDDAENHFTPASEIASWIPGTIDTLPEKYREAVKMFEIENRSQQEIADALGISLSGAKSRIQRGRKLIKKALDDCCVFQRDRRGRPVDYEKREDGTEAACGCKLR